jgi:hypothetical protein
VAREIRHAPPAAPSVGDASEALGRALDQAGGFAAMVRELEHWREIFGRAAQMLDAAEPIAPYHPDILPPAGYSLPARRLLAASVAGYVFGAMGSWNDYTPEPDLRGRYDDVSSRLYDVVLGGLMAAVNSRVEP